MENFNTNKDMQNHSGKVVAGVVILVAGALLLVNNIWIGIPDWIFKWHTFLMALGLYLGAKHNFRNSGWLVIFLIGTYFTLDEAIPNLSMSHVVFPIMLVILGIFLIFKPKSKVKHKAKWRKFNGPEQFTPYTEVGGDETSSSSQENKTNSNDYIDSVNVFGGSNQTIFSKNFKGGEITAVFGGCDVNLSQADFEGEIAIDVTAIFGGAKIIVPPGWDVKSEVTAVFGGLDDKRSIQPLADGNRKLLVVRGIALFGGVDIRNY